MHPKIPALSTNLCGLVLVIAAVGCGGGDSTAPKPASFAGSYPGQFYVIATSTVPSERDSTNGGPVTLTLASTTGESYDFSVTTSSGGSSGSVDINSAGAMSFPNFDESSALNLLRSMLVGICNLSGVVGTPSGSVVAKRLTLSILATGATCDWSGGSGTPDIRPTHIQLTWTGNRA